MRSRSKGFTLIELLVVIAIIGILSSVVFASLQSARSAANDARRLSDMKQLQNALELYYGDNAQYPANPVSTQVANMNVGQSNITPYINPIPTDPERTGAQGYRYRISDSNGRQSYTMLVRLNKNPTWCRFGMPPGHSSWVANYPEC